MTDTIAAGQLRAFVERIERIEAEIKEMNADKSEVYKELRGVGFDVKAVRQCVAARKLDMSELQERNAVFDMYWDALTGASRVHVHEEQIFTASNRKGANTENDHVDGSAVARTEASEDVVALTGQIESPIKAEIIDGNASLAAREGEQAAAPIPDPFEPPAFLVKAAKPLRPLCLNPSECAGYGSHTCHQCLKASGQAEVAA